MKINSILNNIIWSMTVIMFASFYVLESYTWGKYLLAIISVAVFMVTLFTLNGFKVFIERYHMFVFIFACYCIITCAWAWSPEDAVSKGVTILEILTCFSLIYSHFRRKESIDALLGIIMWGGYAVAVYSFFAYGGVGQVISLMIGEIRLENDFSNVNTIGMITAMACIIQVYYLLNRKSVFSSVFMIPAFVIIIATQSRKALVLLIFGILGVLIFHNSANKKFVTILVRIITVLLAAVILIMLLSSLPVFDKINDRMQGLFSSITGVGDQDHSSWLREQYRNAGFRQFFKTPVVGIGIGSSYFLTQAFDYSTYLHCNYAELLACGGLVGFILYYAMYAYLYYVFIKYRKYDYKSTMMCLLIMTLLFIMDYGTVSYYTKSQYFYFMMFFIQSELLRKKKREELKARDGDACLKGEDKGTMKSAGRAAGVTV